MKMDKDKTAKQLRKTLKDYASRVQSSPEALFTINRRINDSEIPLKRAYGKLRPSLVLGGLLLLVMGLLAGILYSRSTTPNSEIQTIAPVSTVPSTSNNLESSNIATETTEVQAPASTTSGVTSCAPDRRGSQPNHVTVYFYCGSQLVALQRPSEQNTLQAALSLLAEGLTQAEIQAGYRNYLINDKALAINSVQVDNHWAIVNLSDSLPENRNNRIANQLNHTVFEFSDVKMVEYQIDGSCQTFASRALESGDSCFTFISGPTPIQRLGGGDRRVVAFRLPQLGRRTIYTCPNTSCQTLGEVPPLPSTATYRFTGGVSLSIDSRWIEVLAPSGNLGWVNSDGVSVQLPEGTDDIELFGTIASSVNSGAHSHLLASHNLYGVLVSSAPYHNFFIRDLQDPQDAANFKLLTDALKDARLVERSDPILLLNNLEHITLLSKSQDRLINIHFDFSNDTPIVIAISIHKDIEPPLE